MKSLSMLAVSSLVLSAFAFGCTPGSVDLAGPSTPVPKVVVASVAPIKSGRVKGPTKVDNQPEPVPAAQPTTPVAAANVLADAGMWSQFRGPTGMGVSTAKLPTKWSATENLAWKVPLPGPGASSPVVFGDAIYLTYYTGYFVPGQGRGSEEDLKRHVLALKRTNGETIWDKTIAAKLPEKAPSRGTGFAPSTPAADADGVVIFFGKSGVIAFDHEGNQKWEADVGSGSSDWGSAPSPVLYKDLVIVNASVESETLYALDRKTGEVRWKQGSITEAWNTPVIVTSESGRRELIVAVHGRKGGEVLAFDPDKGTPLWNCKTGITWYMVPSIVADKGIVYVLGGRSGITSLAIRTGGKGDVTETHRLWTEQTGSNVTSPVFHDGHLYFANDNQGIALCLKAETGEVVYKERLERADQIYASAILADGNAYYLTRSGRTFVIAAKPKFEQVAINDLRDGGIFDGSPQVAENQILIRSDKFLYCIGK